MTFEEVQQEWFFDAFNHVSGGGDLTKWIDIETVLQWAATKITRAKADELLLQFTENIHYIEKNDEGQYRLSDSAKVYYEFLKKESKKYDLDKASVESTINTGRLTRRNIRIGWVLGSATFLIVAVNLIITSRKISQDTERLQQETLKQLQDKQVVPQLIQELHQISLCLSDTSTKKVRIEK